MSLRTAIAIVLALGAQVATAQDLPDLRLDVERLGAGVNYDLQTFAVDSCELQAADLCVGAPGARKLLRFDVFAINQGTADLVLGVPDETTLLPDDSPMWVYSDCHRHFHFTTFARYELRRRGESTVVVTGQKRSFCVEDTQAAGASTSRRYCCNAECDGVQGIQVGWGDLYPSTLKCQWIDITEGVPPGDYDLCVLLNTAGILPDGDPSNDVGCVPVTIGGPPAGAAAPRVKVRAPRGKKGGRVGRPLKIAWQKKVKGEQLAQEVWFSSDDGQTWTLLAGDDAVPGKKHAYRWVVPADAVTEQGRVRVVVWAKNPKTAPVTDPGAIQSGTGETGPFRIVP